MADRKARQDAKNEQLRREEERRQFKEAQELESLRRTFKRMDKKGDGKVDYEELMAELEFLQYKVTSKEANLIIWEVDDDADGCVDWEEFRTMFYRTRDDATGCEPRKLFNVVEFLMHDKNQSGLIDLDECNNLFYAHYGKEVVDEKISALDMDEDADKSLTFAKFVEVQRYCAKRQSGSGLKPGATMVPQVKGMAYVVDPSLAHLL